ncbi:MAG: pilus assembly protein [Clostridiales bacterium]|nr:pilus assembly protein [Clostridiales bacterium]
MKKFFKSEKGQSFIEFALVLPILLILVGGIIDFGWFFYNQSALNNSAREGARFAIVQTAKTERIELIEEKINSVTPGSLKPVTIEITYSNMQTPLLGDVTIKLSANVRVLTPVMGVFTGQNRTLSAQATMKVES